MTPIRQKTSNSVTPWSVFEKKYDIFVLGGGGPGALPPGPQMTGVLPGCVIPLRARVLGMCCLYVGWAQNPCGDLFREPDFANPAPLKQRFSACVQGNVAKIAIGVKRNLLSSPKSKERQHPGRSKEVAPKVFRALEKVARGEMCSRRVCFWARYVSGPAAGVLASQP